ncbi:MAG: Rnf-Nqr domain containing protein [Candidatus Porifericomitaceae bacterium WSBS_2022_MAG_OTU9]
MDNLLHILFAAALTDNMVANRMYGVTLVQSTRQAWPMTMLITAATAALLLLAVLLGHMLRQLSFAGEDGLVVPLLLPLLALALALVSCSSKLDRRWQAILPLTIANTALLAIPLTQAGTSMDLTASITEAIGSALGFGLVLLAICELRQRLWLSDVPKPLQGLPILLLMLGSMGIALHGLHV